MNRLLTTLFSVTLFALALDAPLSQARVGAQAPVTADIVAARMHAFYDETRTVQARFRQHSWERIYDRSRTEAGRIAIQRPGRIRFDYERTGNILVSSDDAWIFYEPGDDHSAGQFARGSAAAASQTAFGILMGTADVRGFRRALLPARPNQPSNTDALELTQRRPDPHYRHIRVYVDNQPGRLGIVNRVSVEDPDGNWNTFDFFDLHFNRDLDDALFTFAPPQGARELGAPRRRRR